MSEPPPAPEELEIRESDFLSPPTADFYLSNPSTVAAGVAGMLTDPSSSLMMNDASVLESSRAWGLDAASMVTHRPAGTFGDEAASRDTISGMMHPDSSAAMMSMSMEHSSHQHHPQSSPTQSVAVAASLMDDLRLDAAVRVPPQPAAKSRSGKSGGKQSRASSASERAPRSASIQSTSPHESSNDLQASAQPARSAPGSPAGGPDRGGAAAAGAMTAEAKAAIRRDRNRFAAQKSRSRKKEFFNGLNERLETLCVELAGLREEHARVAQARIATARGTLRGGGRDALAAASTFWGPESVDRRLLTAYQFERASRTIAPAHSRFLWWVTDRDGSSTPAPHEPYASGASPHLGPAPRQRAAAAPPPSQRTLAARKIWSEICESELSLSTEQRNRLTMLMRGKVLNGPEAAAEQHKINFTHHSLTKMRAAADSIAQRLTLLNTRILDIVGPENIDAHHEWLAQQPRSMTALETLVVRAAPATMPSVPPEALAPFLDMGVRPRPAPTRNEETGEIVMPPAEIIGRVDEMGNGLEFGSMAHVDLLVRLAAGEPLEE